MNLIDKKSRLSQENVVETSFFMIHMDKRLRSYMAFEVDSF